MDTLPHWEPGTAAVLCAAGPHPIPVSTAVRAGDRQILFVLGGQRDTLARLRDDPRAALCMLGAGFAFTAYGSTETVAEGLAAAPSLVAVALAVEELQDHLADGRTEVLSAASWRWRERRYVESDVEIFAELERLAR